MRPPREQAAPCPSGPMPKPMSTAPALGAAPESWATNLAHTRPLRFNGKQIQIPNVKVAMPVRDRGRNNMTLSFGDIDRFLNFALGSY